MKSDICRNSEWSNAFDSLAEAYQVAGDRGLAKSNYRNAIELDPSNVDASTMLAQSGYSVAAMTSIAPEELLCLFSSTGLRVGYSVAK